MPKVMGPRNLFSQQLHREKYRQNGESFDDYCVRYARTTADDESHFRKLLDGLRTQAILPAGRQQRAVGWPFQTTAFNCFVSDTIPDSMEGIMDALKDAAMTLRSGGGCGWDFSTLRGSNEPVRGLGDGAKASGPVSFMGMWNMMCSTIRSAGERRGAMMGVLRVDHPDIMQFVKAKQNTNSLTNFNISVGITEGFMEAVEGDKLFHLQFGGTKTSTVRALDLWSLIMDNNWDWAEPGVLFLDTINRMNPLRYIEYIAATNPCFSGETEVLTRKGYKRIDSLVGQEVEAWNGERWSKVSPKVTGEMQPLVEVVLSNGVSLRCTPYHGFLVEDKGQVEAAQLEEGMALESFGMPILESGDTVGVAYQQGLFAGDGSWKRKRAEIWLYGDKKLLLSHLSYDSVNEYQTQNGTRLQVLLKGDMRPKDWVPDCLWSVKSRLDWFAGLCDTDGTAVKTYGPDRKVSSVSIQVTSADKKFLLAVRKMLTTLGIDPVVTKSREGGNKLMPDGKGGSQEYPCQASYRLQVSAWDLKKLQGIGFRTNRLRITENDPQRGAGRKTRVVSVTPAGVAEKVYCFNEPIAHRGTFEGVVTGQCAEQPLPPNGACLLLSHNMIKYVVPTYSKNGRGGYEIDYDSLEEDVDLSVRACDNVFDKTIYPLEAYKREAFNKRRMGVGVTGMANALEICGHPYAGNEYIWEQSKILRIIRDTAYRTSIEMARVKGSFPLFDADKWLASGFGQTLPDDIRDGIKRYGLRNGLLLSIAPTGTISWAADNVSSGIEPPPVLEGVRKVIMSEGEIEVSMNDCALEEYGVRCRTGPQCDPSEHVDVLCEAQKFVDSAISKTINIRGANTTPPEKGHTTFTEFKEVYMDVYKGGGKGCATFNMNGKRAGIIRERQTDLVPESCQFDSVTGAKTCG